VFIGLWSNGMEKYFKYSQCLRLSIVLYTYNQMKRRRQHCSETKFLAQHPFRPSRLALSSPCCSKCSLTTHHTSLQTEKITSPATPRDTFSPNFKDLQKQQTRNLTRIRSPHLDNLSFGPPSPKRLSTAIAETWFPGCHGRD
jgi:hypothetical protein